MNFPRGTKKRKQADSLDGERSLYASFSHAANAVSQLYTAAVQQTKRAEEAGARQALERVAQFVVKEYGNAPAVPTAVLMEVLRQELQAAQGSAATIQLPFPMPLLPADSDEGLRSDDEHTMSEQPMPASTFRRSGSGHTISPPKGRSGAPGLPAMFTQAQQQQQQMHAAQLAHMQAAHLAMQQQQQQQQQASGAGFGFQGHPPPFQQ
ncbi:hypothetical protein ABPG77_007156 [Micractinium sp. CCAP 211/92]